MAAAAHTPGGYGGVPQSVGKEFNDADTGRKRSSLPKRVSKKPSKEVTDASNELTGRLAKRDK